MNKFEEMLLNLDFIRAALSGDEDAARVYCGSYTLARSDYNGLYYRVKGDIPNGYTKLEGVYDKDGFLLREFWSLPRLGIDV